MIHIALLFLAALTAVSASEKTVSVVGTVTCEWTDYKYNESVLNDLKYSFKRTSDNSEVPGGKEVSYQKVNSTNGNIAVVLTFKPPRPKDVQSYLCQLWFNESDKVEKTVPLSALPVPVVDTTSVTIFEGESLNINCTFKSTSAYRLGNFTFRRYKEDPASSVLPDNAKVQEAQEAITIAVADKKNRGLYTCTATNDIGSTRTEVYVRVKSPLAALWPAIGIFLEVVVLIVIVFVYERRREAAKQQNAAEGDDAHNNSRDKSKNSSDVRQRAVKA